MKSNYKMKYVELPLSVFAAQYPAQFFALLSHKLPPDAIFDSRYIVRLQITSDGGFNLEVGYSDDEWIISDHE